MSTILVIRHGETPWNRTNREQGWAPVALNDRGRKQARQLGRYLGNTYSIDRIYTSDLRRSRQTIVKACESGDISPTVSYDKRLRERNLGVLQGAGPRLKKEYSSYFLPEGGTDAVTNRPENGESYDELRNRVVDWWQSILEDVQTNSGEDPTYLVGAHGGVIRVLLSHIQDINFVRAFGDIPQDNCSINKIKYVGEDMTVLTRNNTSFID